MYQRITNRSLYTRSLNDIQRNATSLYRLQGVVSSGLRFQRISEDPTGGARALRLQREEELLTSYQRTSDQVKGSVDVAMNKLDDVQQLLSEAKALAIQSANGTASADDRETIANRIDSMLSEILTLANARFDERYLFAGAKVDTLPFELVEGSEGTRILYRGDDNSHAVRIGSSDSVLINVPGSRTFNAMARRPTEYRGTTGAAAGSGMDSATGEDTLVVRHVATFFGDEAGPQGGDTLSGLQPGTSTAGDTVLGVRGAHSITVDANAGTIQLDGGAVVNFNGGDPDLRLVNENGEVVHVDVTALTPGFAGTVELRGAGRMSVDGGLTELDISYEANQTLVDSVTGKVTHVDSSAIRSAGEEYLRYPGSADAFEALIGLSAALKNTRGLDQDSQLEVIRGSIEDLERLQNHVLTVEGELGARSSHLDDVMGRLEDEKLTVRTLLSNVQDADLSEAIIDFTRAEAALQAAQQVAVRVMQNSYSAFLR